MANQWSCHVNGFVCKAGSLMERLELLILETNAGYDGLYDEKLDLSKQLLSMNIINKEQLDNFVFNSVKWASSQLRWWTKFLQRR